MPHWSSYMTGRYQASEADLQLNPKYASGNRRVVFCHGAGQDATVGTDPTKTGQMPLLQALAEKFPIMGADLGGAFTWGNATCQTRCETARAYLGASKVHLLAVSMGGLTALQYAKANPTRVQSIALIIPAIDLNYAYQNDVQTSRASIGTAWGVTYPTALPAGANPQDNASAWSSIPLKIWYVTNDPYTPVASTTNVATGSNGTAVSLGALGHTEGAIAAVPAADVASFFQAAA